MTSSTKLFNRLKYPFAILMGIVVFSSFSLSLIKADLIYSILAKRNDGWHGTEIQIYDHNIKNNADPSHLEAGEQPWDVRKQGILAFIESRTSEYPTLIGLQEVLQDQLDDILSGLGDTWAYAGIPRAVGGPDNEYNPIIYDTTEFTVLSNKTFWLSETPWVPSQSWGAAYIRIVNVVTLSHIQSQKRVNYLNTHFDHISQEARNNSAALIVDIVNHLDNPYPTFLSGDFNSNPASAVYSILTNRFTDANQGLDKRQFSINYNNTIDYIFYEKDEAELVDFQTLSGVYDGYYTSDHTPIYGVFKI